MRTPQRPGRRSVPWLVLAASLLLIAGCVVVLVVHGRAPAAGRVPPGTEVFGYVEPAGASGATGPGRAVEGTVDLPYGRLSFRVESAATPAHTTSSFSDDDYEPSLMAPQGGSFLVVRMSLSTTDREDALGGSSYPDTTLSLGDGARAYPLPVLAGSIRGIAGITRAVVDSVAISRPSGSLTGLSLSVSFDGVTQRLDLRTGRVDGASVADALAATSQGQRLSCGTVHYRDGFRPAYRSITPRCEVTVRSAAWVASTGWAPSGSRYVAVHYDAGAAFAVRLPDGGVSDVDGGGWQVRLGALRPQLITTSDDGESTVPLDGHGEAVFLIPLGARTPPRLTVLGSGLVDGQQSVRWSWSVRLPAEVRG